MTEFNVGFEDHGVEVKHYFGDDGSGVYIKEVHIPAGKILQMHKHSFTHKSVLVKGSVIISEDGQKKYVYAPHVLTMDEGVEHEVRSLEDSVWLCIHATDESDESKIDHTLVRHGS